MSDDATSAWEVPFEVGPVDGRLAHAWLANSRRIIDGVRRHRLEVSIHASEAMLDLAEVYLDVWIDAAAGVEVFHWRARRDVRQIQAMATEWTNLAAMTPEDFELIGCSRAPIETQPFIDALLDGVTRSLASHPGTIADADELQAQPPEGPTSARD